jgi:hypothetical protein
MIFLSLFIFLPLLLQGHNYPLPATELLLEFVDSVCMTSWLGWVSLQVAKYEAMFFLFISFLLNF